MDALGIKGHFKRVLVIFLGGKNIYPHINQEKQNRKKKEKTVRGMGW